jgi:CRISPR-associated protein Csb2
VLVFAPKGFDARARDALSRVRTAYAAKMPRFFLTLVGVGERADFAAVVPCVREAHVWHSALPFVPPRHLKPRGAASLEGQVQAELASRGLPAAECIEVELEGGAYIPASDFWSVWEQRAPGRVRMSAAGGDQDDSEPGDPGAPPQIPRLASRWLRFRRERVSEGSPKPPVTMGLGLRITFGEDVPGPIALGYASHFGLGLLEPGG